MYQKKQSHLIRYLIQGSIETAAAVVYALSDTGRESVRRAGGPVGTRITVQSRLSVSPSDEELKKAFSQDLIVWITAGCTEFKETLVL